MKPSDLPPPKYAMDGGGKYFNMKIFIVEYRIPGVLTFMPMTRNIAADNEAGAIAIFNATKAENEIFVRTTTPPPQTESPAQQTLPPDEPSK